MSALVDARNLAVDYDTPRGTVRALDGATLELAAGGSVGVVGESGSGKSTLGMAMGRLLPSNAFHAGGSLMVGGHAIFDMDDETLAGFRRDALGFVFQSPISALNPTARVGAQLRWAAGRKLSDAEIAETLTRVGLSDTRRVTRAYPHELSGGMAQRVVIATAIAREPSLLIADEPTAALDASIRGQILDLLGRIRAQTGSALMLLTHDLSIVTQHCDRIAVMYGGRVVEDGPSHAVFAHPAHPYTRTLLRAAPGQERPGERLEAIPGAPPMLTGPCPGCAFAPRCPQADALCRTERPALRGTPDRQTLCHHADLPRLDPGDTI